MNIKKYYKTYRVLPPDYFYFENAGDGENTLSIYQSNTTASLNIPIYYSFDAIDWQLLGTLNTSTISTTPLQIKHTDKIFLRATATRWSAGLATATINATNNVKAGGNIMSLLYAEQFEDKKSLRNSTYTFENFFMGLGSKLLSVDNLNLPATILGDMCYSHMFFGCTSLVTAPKLPATTLANNCYEGMFRQCTKLTTAPALPATTLANYCYQYMFNGCTKLTTAPELPATTLANYCYQYMFNGCSELNYIKADFLTTPSATYMSNWLEGVSSTGTFVKNKNATWTNAFGTSAIPTRWNVVTE